MQIGELEVLSLFDGRSAVAATGAYRMGPEGLKGGDEADWEPHQDLLDDGMLEFVFGGFLDPRRGRSGDDRRRRHGRGQPTRSTGSTGGSSSRAWRRSA